MQIAMIDDNIVPLEQLEPIYFDRGMYFGDGIYEVVRSYNGRIFALDEHLARFSNGLAAIEITAIADEDVRSRVLRAFEAANIADAKIYFHITRGSAPRKHCWDENLKPNFFLTVTSLADFSELKAKGISVSTYPDLRWKRCDIKSLNLLPNVLARRDAAVRGCYEAILVGEDGFITEGAGSAFFAVVDGALQTAPVTSNILPSVTRRFVIKAAQNIGLAVNEKPLTTEQAIDADELFIAVTTTDIVGVVKFDGIVIGDGGCGDCTKKLTQQFLSFTV